MRSGNSESWGKSAIREWSNVCLFSISDDAKSGKEIYNFVSIGALLNTYASGIGCWGLQGMWRGVPICYASTLSYLLRGYPYPRISNANGGKKGAYKISKAKGGQAKIHRR